MRLPMDGSEITQITYKTEDTVVKIRIKKGHHGYIKRKKRLLLGEVLGLLIGFIGLVVIGVVTTGSR